MTILCRFFVVTATNEPTAVRALRSREPLSRGTRPFRPCPGACPRDAARRDTGLWTRTSRSRRSSGRRRRASATSPPSRPGTTCPLTVIRGHDAEIDCASGVPGSDGQADRPDAAVADDGDARRVVPARAADAVRDEHRHAARHVRGGHDRPAREARRPAASAAAPPRGPATASRGRAFRPSTSRGTARAPGTASRRPSSGATCGPPSAVQSCCVLHAHAGAGKPDAIIPARAEVRTTRAA